MQKKKGGGEICKNQLPRQRSRQKEFEIYNQQNEN